MPKELVIPSDDPNIVKVFDPYSIQGMLNALTFLAQEVGTDVKPINDVFGRTYGMMIGVGVAEIILAPSPSGLSAKHVMVISRAGSLETSLVINSPDKVECDWDAQWIKFYARDPSAVLSIHVTDVAVEAELKVTDIKHHDRVHGGTIKNTPY